MNDEDSLRKMLHELFEMPLDRLCVVYDELVSRVDIEDIERTDRAEVFLAIFEWAYGVQRPPEDCGEAVLELAISMHDPDTLP